MSDNSATVCPWCQTEIVWDEEVGPEETCPHCFNELNDYRSLHVRLDGDELELADDDDELTELSGYEAAVRQRLERQEDTMECVRCQDEMVLTGEMTVSEHQFAPARLEGAELAFLPAPFAMKVFVCPSCFHVSQTLSDRDRMRLVEQWSSSEGK